jgi:polysaccharide biosynthesis protein PslG
VDRNGLRGALAALLACAGLCAAVSGCAGGGDHAAAAGPPRVVVGLDANTFHSDVARDQRAIRPLGIRDLREQLRWDHVEPRRGAWRFAEYDAKFLTSARNGMRILPLLFATPSWQARTPRRLPPHAAPWARFVARVAARYGPGGSFWRAHPELPGDLAPRAFELWNEPSYRVFAVGGVDAAHYARLVRAAAVAGHRANPRARFLVYGDTAYAARDGSIRDWIADMFAAVPDLGRVVDGIAVHPYTLGSPLSVTSQERNDFRRVDQIRVEAQERGGRALPIWITEIGWSTCRLRPDCVSEARQAQYVTQLFGMLQGHYRGKVAAAYVYQWHSLHGVRPADREGFFGLLRENGSRKPAWAAVRRAALAARGR